MKIAQHQSYNLISNTSIIEDNSVKQYGIEQTYLTENGEQIITRIDSISDEIEVVTNLIDLLSDEDVDNISLEYIVEDYVGEISDYIA